MRVAAYARVSTTRQAQAQGIEQQLDRLRAAAAERGWELDWPCQPQLAPPFSGGFQPSSQHWPLMAGIVSV